MDGKAPTRIESSEEKFSHEKKEDDASHKTDATTSSKPADGMKNFQLIGSVKVAKFKSDYIISVFRILFEEFPDKMETLRAMIANDQNPRYRYRTDIVTKVEMFSVPPSLHEIEEEESKNKKKNTTKQQCNYNRQYPVFLNYDGFIKSNPYFMKFLAQFEPLCQFYLRWSEKFTRAMDLCIPPIQKGFNNVEIETQEYCKSIVNDIADMVRGFSDYETVIKERLETMLRIQKNPHLFDYRSHFFIQEQQIWFNLVSEQRALHHCYVMTFDLIAKNFHNLVNTIVDSKLHLQMN